MSVFFFKPRGTWAVQWCEEGKRIRRYFKTEQEASAYEQERLAPEASRLTVGELVLSYLRSNPTHEKTRSNIVNFLSGGGKYAEGAGQFMFGKYADSLNRIDLERMRENMRSHGAGNNTINKYQAYMRAILAWGADQQLIPLNPWRDFKRLRCESACNNDPPHAVIGIEN